jgi:hypothetical protein
MSAILHSIITGIEYERIRNNLKHWRICSNSYFNHVDTLIQIQEDDKDIYLCEECEGYMYSDKYLLRGNRVCGSCLYEPNWEDAFSKFGHIDGGASNYITEKVVNEIEALGYDCCGNKDSPYYDENNDWRSGWGCHNGQVITKIVNSNGQIIYPKDGQRVGGYDNYDLPNDIMEAIIDLKIDR